MPLHYHISVLRPSKPAVKTQSDANSKPKRTRICEAQSRNGCFNCEARRIKCDETKPTCLRCARSNRACEGFPAGAQSLTSGTVVTPETRAKSNQQANAKIDGMILSPSHHLRSRPKGIATEWQYLLGRKGVGLIAHDSFVVFGSSGAVLDTLLRQLCHSIPAINSAAIALGAAYELQTSRKPRTSQDDIFAHCQYQVALRTMHREFAAQPHGPVPLILMCFMLGVTEILLQQERNALYHMRAAYKLSQDRKQTRDLVCVAKSEPTRDEWLQEDDLEVVFRTLDLETCAYVLSNHPDLPVASIQPTLPVMTDLTSARVTLVQLVHASYAFTSQVYPYKYHPRSATPAMHIQQGRFIAHLSSWLERFNLNTIPTLPSNSVLSASMPRRLHVLTLRVTATSTLIYLSCILSPYETSYDAYATHFQRIISDAEEVISFRPSTHDRTTTNFAKQGSNARFSPGPGSINPLFITAIRYRHPQDRRKAITLLFRAGQEGPWLGRREATVAAEVMAIEEEPHSAYIRDGQSMPTSYNPTPSSNGILGDSEDTPGDSCSSNTPLALYNTSTISDNRGLLQDKPPLNVAQSQDPFPLDVLEPPAPLPSIPPLPTLPSLEFPSEQHRIHGESIVFPRLEDSPNHFRYRHGSLRSFPATSSKSGSGRHGPSEHEDPRNNDFTTSTANPNPDQGQNTRTYFSPNTFPAPNASFHQDAGKTIGTSEIHGQGENADDTDIALTNISIEKSTECDVDGGVDNDGDLSGKVKQKPAEAGIRIATGDEGVDEIGSIENKRRCRGHEQWEMWDEVWEF